MRMQNMNEYDYTEDEKLEQLEAIVQQNSEQAMAEVKEMVDEIVTELKELRKEGGLYQADLSALTGIPQKTISMVENLNDIPKLYTLNRLAKAYGYQVKIELVKEE